MLPTAAGFVDPLLSTGIPLALLGISRIANILREDWDSPTFLTRLDQYAQETRGEIEAVAELIGGLYRNMAKFSVFRNLSLLYFAAASYAESARRLHKHHLTESFLLCNDHRFGPECRHILQLARGPLDEGEAFQLEESILKLIEPFDVAGLLKRPLNHCYPVRASDLLDSAHKLSATPSEIALLLERSGFFSAAEQVTWKQ
jgi:FADH2 O2-dependent halogenase